MVIVGAGPAGCTAALYAVKHNLKCLIVDKAVFPRDKICGDAFMPVCQEILNEFGLSFEDIGNENYVAVNKVSFYSNEQALHIPTRVYNCPRKRFDDYLFRKISQKVDVIQNCEVVSILKSNDRVNGIRIKTNGNDYTVHSSYVIGADGASSFIRRQLPFTKFSEYAVASRSYLPGVKYPNEFDLNYFADISPGYFWVFKVDDTFINTGVILFDNRQQAQLQNFHKAYLKKFFGKETGFGIDTWQLPFINSSAELAVKGCILIGDAAGLIDPLIGHGIDTAMLSAKYAIEAMVSSENDEQVIRAYSNSVRYGISVNSIRNKLFRDKLEVLGKEPGHDVLNAYKQHIEKGHLDYKLS